MLLTVCLALVVALAGCGGEKEPPDNAATTTPSGKVDFPRGDDKTMRGLRQSAPEEAVLSPSVSVLRVGRNRIGFALFDVGRKQVRPDAVAVYASKFDGSGLRGPFEARSESLRVQSQFMSRQTQADLDEVDAFWVADVPFAKRGRYVLTALASIDGKLISTSQIEMRAGVEGGPPDVGEKAVKVDTDTVASASGDLESIDTRQPPIAELHQLNFADVVGREPTVLAFATPQLCQTRVCGPVVDVVAQVRAQADGVSFIAQEIYKDNDINKGFRPQVTAWRLPTEPWTFVIDHRGRVVERFEGAMSVRELSAAVKKIGRIG